MKAAGSRASGQYPSFVVLAANTPWVYAFARSLADHGSVTVVRFYDLPNYRRLAPRWPDADPRVRRVTCVLPPGYAGRLEGVFRPLPTALVRRETSLLRRANGVEPMVICPYPYLAPWVRDVEDRNLVYYNLDDYVLYEPLRADRIRRLEDELIRRAKLTICLSRHQVMSLRQHVPADTERVVHFPLGVDEAFINPEPHGKPLAGTVGYIGNLTNRVDWGFVERVARALPDIRFLFVGSLENLETGYSNDTWMSDRQRVFSLQNVEHAGKVTQAQVRDHYWRYAVNWMPYDADHPFNIAACPTKIMDALASGRPFLSTDLPEVRLYPDWVHIAKTSEDAIAKLRNLVAPSYPHNADSQITFASGNTWKYRAVRFLELLDQTKNDVRHLSLPLGKIDAQSK